MTQLSEAKATLRNYHALTERQYKGDTDAICTLVDLSYAIATANLTARQTEALALVYGADLTQASAGQRMGIAQDAVAHLIRRATANIDNVYVKWTGENE